MLADFPEEEEAMREQARVEVRGRRRRGARSDGGMANCTRGHDGMRATSSRDVSRPSGGSPRGVFTPVWRA